MMSVPPPFRRSSFEKVPGPLWRTPAVKKMCSPRFEGKGLGTANRFGPPTNAGPVPCEPISSHDRAVSSGSTNDPCFDTAPRSA